MRSPRGATGGLDVGPRMARTVPTVFVVDDDISVRESLELLVRNAGWQPELFETAQEFLSHPRARRPERRPDSRRVSSAAIRSTPRQRRSYRGERRSAARRMRAHSRSHRIARRMWR